MSLGEILKQWEPTEENYRRAIRVLGDVSGDVGYPGPEPGSLLWAARIVSDFVERKEKSA